MISLTIVTPWFEHRELETDYWNAMRVAGWPPVIIVDNGSQPPLPNAWRLETNTGFSHGCNVGLQLARTDAVLFLNSDIVPTDADWLNAIACALEPGVLVGANFVWSPHAAVDGQVIPYLDGWCIAGMRDDLLELGGFDETLEEPAYFSDNLLCLEARAAGMSLREAKVGLVHKRNVTAGDAAKNLDVSLRNQARYVERASQLLVTV